MNDDTITVEEFLSKVSAKKFTDPRGQDWYSFITGGTLRVFEGLGTLVAFATLQ
jgi:hypothetical protein